MNRKQLPKSVVTIILALAVAAIAMAQRTQAPPDDPNLMDLNSAPAEKLMTLPGIDMILAKKIIAGRPYRTKNDIMAKKIIPQEAYNAITNRVTVRQGAGRGATKAR
jgi:DNA uptake protein ComE-like DNA-binding protein